MTQAYLFYYLPQKRYVYWFELRYGQFWTNWRGI